MNLQSLSHAIPNYGLNYDREWKALLDLFNSSLLGMFKVEWEEKDIFSTYFVPIHIPGSNISKQSEDGRVIWNLIQRLR